MIKLIPVSLISFLGLLKATLVAKSGRQHLSQGLNTV